MLRFAALFIGMSIVLAGCGGATPTESEHALGDAGDGASQSAGGESDGSAQRHSAAQLRARATAVAAGRDFRTRLGRRLQDTLHAEGPAAATRVCAVEAAGIRDEVMAAHGVRLGRTSVPGRARSPEATPTGWLAEALDQFQPAMSAGADPAELVLDIHEDLPAGIAFRIVAGIRTERSCTLCHGRDPHPQALEALEASVPGYRAVGFSEGDLRGLLWVEVPTATVAGPD